MSNETRNEESIREAVRENYGRLAEIHQNITPAGSCCCSGSASSCCGGEPASTGVAPDLYTADQVGGLPGSVTEISLGCGNPTAIAALMPGQVVLDLGSGGGIDCFLAAERVGPQGQVIGLDMTPAMLDLARANAKKLGVKNVDFRYGYMEDIPLPDASVDVILSNCVVNLSTDKDQVFREAFRVLRPGGVLNLSDIVTSGTLPVMLTETLAAWASCISGALDENLYLEKIRQAGFGEVQVMARKAYAKELLGCDDGLQAWLGQNRISLDELESRILSITLKAVKPASTG